MNQNGIYQLFVYGSLRSGFKSPAYDYISRFFSLVGDAKVKGRLFDMGSYPAGVPSAEAVTREDPASSGDRLPRVVGQSNLLKLG